MVVEKVLFPGLPASRLSYLRDGRLPVCSLLVCLLLSVLQMNVLLYDPLLRERHLRFLFP